MLITYFFENTIMASGVWCSTSVLTSRRFSTLKMYKAYHFLGEVGFPTPEESLCYGVECVAHNITAFALRCVFAFVRSEASSVISPF